MEIEIRNVEVETLFPITRQVGEIKIAGITIAERIKQRFSEGIDNRKILVNSNFIISKPLADKLSTCTKNLVILDSNGKEELAKVVVEDSKVSETLVVDDESVLICYPWELISLTEKIVGALTENEIEGTVREGAVIDGKIKLGKNSVILPGVYIEGNATIGDNCKIGPNCYIRGNTSIGDKCHIGQSVEVKNSLLFENINIGHLSYVGDSVICEKVNFGAGTITSNFRHDGKSHRFMVKEELKETGRRKMGAIIGTGVLTGINTVIYPGRKIEPNRQTKPGEIIQK